MGPDGASPSPRDWSAWLSGLLVWPCGLARLAAAACALSAVAVLMYQVPHEISMLGADAGGNAALSLADREIGGGNSIVVDQPAAYEAKALIPADSTFRVVIGPKLKGATSLTVPAVSAWFTYFLMPRRQAGGAPFVICYGCDTSTLAGYHELWRDDVGISIGTVS